jgi:Skp family chaperone for outer membrane proteins
VHLPGLDLDFKGLPATTGGLVQLSHYVIAVVLMAMSAPGTAGQLFKCAAADDKVTYQDVPCPASAKTTTIAVDTKTTPPAKSLEQTRKELDAVDKRLAAREQAEAKQRIADERANQKLTAECQKVAIDLQHQAAKPQRPGVVSAEGSDRQKMTALGCPG